MQVVDDLLYRSLPCHKYSTSSKFTVTSTWNPYRFSDQKASIKLSGLPCYIHYVDDTNYKMITTYFDDEFRSKHRHPSLTNETFHVDIMLDEKKIYVSSIHGKQKQFSFGSLKTLSKVIHLTDSRDFMTYLVDKVPNGIDFEDAALAYI